MSRLKIPIDHELGNYPERLVYVDRYFALLVATPLVVGKSLSQEDNFEETVFMPPGRSEDMAQLNLGVQFLRFGAWDEFSSVRYPFPYHSHSDLICHFAWISPAYNNIPKMAIPGSLRIYGHDIFYSERALSKAPCSINASTSPHRGPS